MVSCVTTCVWRFRDEGRSGINSVCRDVNKNLTPKDQDKDTDLTLKDQDKDKDKDLPLKDQDMDKDLTPKDKDKNKDLTHKDLEQDNDLKYVLKKSLRTRTRTRTTARQIIPVAHINSSNVQWWTCLSFIA